MVLELKNSISLNFLSFFSVYTMSINIPAQASGWLYAKKLLPYMGEKYG
jgi:hypothetical protein